jgi:uncharacterized membrane protein YgdD (TMEM256/DUF423 family)
MRWDRPAWIRLAAGSAFISVAAGAFAAHGVTDPAARDWLRTGASYEAIHALAVLACAALFRARPRRAGWAAGLFLAGSALFSGSLYAMALGAPRILGAITPIGGVMFLAGWGLLAWAAGQAD